MSFNSPPLPNSPIYFGQLTLRDLSTFKFLIVKSRFLYLYFSIPEECSIQFNCFNGIISFKYVVNYSSILVVTVILSLMIKRTNFLLLIEEKIKIFKFSLKRKISKWDFELWIFLSLFHYIDGISKLFYSH
jgi:hypothetical protein